jgi:carbonic anhydrase
MALSKRTFLQIAAAAGLAASRPASAQSPTPAGPPKAPERPSPDDALRLLIEGNVRFVEGKGSHSCRTPSDFAALAAGQRPFAAILACADSRVSPEIMFDRGLGDLFVVRVAGNVIAGTGDPLKGSIEYAVAELGAPLIVVMGHSACGAVKAAIAHIDAKAKLPGAINGLVDLIRPAVLKTKGESGDPLDNAVRANVERGVARLRRLDPIVAPAVRKGTVKVVGGVFNLANGKVTMLG